MTKFSSAITTAAILLFSLTARSSADYSGGLGTVDMPFKIATVADWQDLMATATHWGEHFVLTAEIDLEGVALTPVGNDANNFTGVFDGNDHTIRNVDINMPDEDNVGLFGRLGPGARIRNTGLENASIAGRNYVGGLVGYKYDSSITNCHAAGSVRGGDYVGVLVGRNIRGVIANCGAIGSVNASGGYVGGLVGDSLGSVTNCYATASVAGNNRLGGLIGYHRRGNISHCYATGPVNAIADYAGGLVGNNDGGTITNCYATGSVSADDHAGGLVGSNNSYGSVSRAYFLHPDDGGGPDNGCGIPLTDIQMRQQGSFVGWDFVGESVDGTSEIWQMPVGVGYPILSSFNGYAPPVLAGDGTADSPYLISGPNELGTVYHYDPSASYRVTADIDLSGITWSVSPIPAFLGTFDGNDHVIRNLDVNVPDGDDVGVFGYVGFGADIRNIGIEDASIAGRRFVGALAGYNYDGNISNCHVTGSISGQERDVGGLVGYNYDGNISNCYATCSVGGEDGDVGGLVGWNHGSITTCYATGAVSGNGDQIGGLVGWNKEGAITNCYGIGPVSGDGYVGGLAGLNSAGTSGSSAVTNCYATGPVSGDDHVGGLVGENYGSSIANSYATGSVTGDRRVGGLAGYNANYAGIKDSYSTGSVDGNDSVGGFVGSNSCSGLGNSTITNCYTSGSVSGDSAVGGLVGSNCSGIISRAYFLHPDDGGGSDNGFGEPLTDIQMRQRGSFTGWDFAGPDDGNQDIWSICEGTNYARFFWQAPPGDVVCPDGVNGLDFAAVAAHWHETDCAAVDDCDGADIDLSGGVDFRDVAAVSESWLSGL